MNSTMKRTMKLHYICYFMHQARYTFFLAAINEIGPSKVHALSLGITAGRTLKHYVHVFLSHILPFILLTFILEGPWDACVPNSHTHK